MSKRLARWARSSLFLGCSLLAAACASENAGQFPTPAGSSAAVTSAGDPVTPQITGDYLIAADGAKLPLRVWLPEGEVKAVVLGLHGFNDYSNAFAIPAREWAKDGIATYAYDQRGFGQAPLRGHWAGIPTLTADVTTASRLVRQHHPGVPLYLLGESMGGAIVIAAVTGAAGTPVPDSDGIILAAPAVWNRDTMNVFERVALWTAYELFPALTFTGSGLHIMPSDNIEMLRGLSRDPLVIKETRVDAIKGLVDLMDMAAAAAPRLSQPMLLLYGDRDELVPKEPTRLMIDRLPFAARGERRIGWYAQGYHMLLRDLKGPLVMHDIEAWIADHRAPLPSGADRYASALLFAAR